MADESNENVINMPNAQDDAAPGAQADGEQEGVNIERVQTADFREVFSNIFFVGGTMEEVAVEFGNLVPLDGARVRCNTRVYMSYYAAKRLSAALANTVQQYEAQRGELEVDLQKRLGQGDATS